MPDVLYEAVVQVEERVVLHREDCQLDLSSHAVGTTGEKVTYTSIVLVSISA